MVGNSPSRVADFSAAHPARESSRSVSAGRDWPPRVADFGGGDHDLQNLLEVHGPLVWLRRQLSYPQPERKTGTEGAKALNDTSAVARTSRFSR
jgi:hypothetical protein